MGRVSGAVARNEAATRFQGDIAAVRVYQGTLPIAALSDNFDAARHAILNLQGGGSVFVTANGATVTLNADGSVTYDGSTLTADLLPGATLVDTFTYTISNGDGGTTTATASVTVTGVDENFLAIDDGPVAIGENDGPTTITVLANDIQSGATVEIATVSADYVDDFTSGSVVGEVADFSGTTGWRYLWNAPTDWDLLNSPNASTDGTTGALGSVADYELLRWSGDRWTADGDNDTFNNDPSGYLRLLSDGSGHPGLGSGAAGAVSNNQERAAIAAYTVPADGVYAIGNSAITLPAFGGVDVKVYVDSALVATTSHYGPPGSFDTPLGSLTAGQVIHVAASPQASAGFDSIEWDFSILKLPVAGMGSHNLRGTVSTDGTTVTYTPAPDSDFLPVGSSITETFQYRITDGGSGSSVATVTVTVDGANDAPLANDDANATAEDAVVAGNVLANDTDPDLGESGTLVVGAVTGGTVGSQFALPSGALLTLAADGSYSYDPNGAFDFLGLGQTAQDTFTYNAQDEHGLDSSTTATVTVDIAGAGVSNAQTVATNTTQSVAYPAGATGVSIDPAIVVTDPNGRVASTVAPVYTVSAATTAAFGLSPVPVLADGFALSVTFTPVAADLGAGTLAQVYEIGGNSNGNGIYLKDGIPYWICKMNAANPDVPSGLDDTDWTGNVVCIPLSGSVIAADVIHEVSMVFDLDSVSFSLDGSAVSTIALTGRSGQSDWVGGNNTTYGNVEASSGSRGGLTEGSGGLFGAVDAVSLAGTIHDGRFWTSSDPTVVAIDSESVTATLTINPADGSFTAPPGSTYASGTGIWTATGIPAQVTAALAAVEFVPNGTSPVAAALNIVDGLEDGTSAVTGTLTFELLDPYGQWVVDNGVTGGPGDDDDSDGLSNELEFGLGTDPKSGDNLPLLADGTRNGTPIAQASGGGGGVTFDFVFVRRDDFGTSGSVSYTVQFSNEMTTWYNSGATPGFVADSTDDPDYQVVKVPYPAMLPNGKKARFARLSVDPVP